MMTFLLKIGNVALDSMMTITGFGAFVAQHFLLSAAARMLCLSAVARMSDEELHATFQRIRWPTIRGALLPALRLRRCP
jgi:hypothetical protein